MKKRTSKGINAPMRVKIGGLANGIIQSSNAGIHGIRETEGI
jgi:hypothetical protein